MSFFHAEDNPVLSHHSTDCLRNRNTSFSIPILHILLKQACDSIINAGACSVAMETAQWFSGVEPIIDNQCKMQLRHLLQVINNNWLVLMKLSKNVLGCFFSETKCI